MQQGCTANQSDRSIAFSDIMPMIMHFLFNCNHGEARNLLLSFDTDILARDVG